MSDPAHDDLDRELDAALHSRRLRERAKEERTHAVQAANNLAIGEARLLAARFNKDVHSTLWVVKDKINERLHKRDSGIYEIRKEGNRIPASVDAVSCILQVYKLVGATSVRIGRMLEVTLTADGNVLAKARKHSNSVNDPMADGVVMPTDVIPLFGNEGRIASSLDGFAEATAEYLVRQWVKVILSYGTEVRGR